MSTAAATQQDTKQAKSLTLWEGFQTELEIREQEICSMLPGHVNKERFKNSVVAAVKQTPGLLKATPRSFFGAVTKSAQDGLLPDGREGVITVYGTEAQWNPMAFGLRKRARELDQIIVDAQVVYQNDIFDQHQGDEPRIEHDPAPLGTPRGEMIGAYAVFRNQAGILHREVMDASQIEKVKSQSKNPDGLLWGKFEAEAWRKTVVRRGFKSVPCSEKLGDIVRRDDDNYQFDQPELENAPPRPQRVAYQPKPPAHGADLDAEHRRVTKGYVGDEPEDEPDDKETGSPSEDATGDEGPGSGEGTPNDPPAGSPTVEGDHVGKEFGLPPENRDHAKDLAWLKETAEKAETDQSLKKWLAKEATEKVVAGLPDDLHEDWLAHLNGVFEALGAMA